MPAGFETMPLEFRELSPGYRALAPKGMARWLHEANTGRTGKTPAPPPADAPAPPAEGAADTGWAGFAALSMPMLILTGDADIYMPPAVLPLFKAHAAQARLAVIDGAAHATYWEQPDAFNDTVLSFLRQL